MWHIPPYDVAERHWSQQGDYREITQLIDGNIDWVLTGHEHLYQRFKPLRFNAQFAPSGNYGNGLEDGAGYLVLPPAGQWPADQVLAEDHQKGYYRDRLSYPEPESDETTVPSEIGFTLFELNERNLKLTTYGIGTLLESKPYHIVDQISYTK